MKKILQFFVPIVGLSIVAYVVHTSIAHNGGWAGTWVSDESERSYNLIRLAGLTTFVLLSFQIITGTFMHLFNMLYSKRFYFFHSYSGILVLILASTHYALSHLYMHLNNLTIFTFTDLYPKPFVTLGPIALTLLFFAGIPAVIAVLILNQKPARWWRYFHYANYLVFILVFIHSLNIGTDVSGSSQLKTLWWTFFILFIAGTIYKRIIRPIQKKAERKQAVVAQ